MRLFFAILLEEEVKDGLCACMDEMRQKRIRANYSLRENLHMTLAFLGETCRMGSVKKAMDQAAGQPFTLQTTGLSSFRSQGGALVYANLNPVPELMATQKNLFEALCSEGFELKQQEFRPHITIARRAYFPSGIQLSDFDCSGLFMKAAKISLMKSERIGGKLSYSELLSRKL